MRVDVATSSRELFGSDRSALRLAEVLRGLGHVVRLAVPAHRPEHGLTDLVRARGIEVIAAPIAIATSRGLERPRSLAMPWPGPRPDVLVLNTTAVMIRPRVAARRILVVREWLLPERRVHRILARWHRAGVDEVVGISSGVVEQWRRTAGPRAAPGRRIWNWLDEDWLGRTGEPGAERRDGIICVGRFNAWKGQDVLADAFERAFPAGGDAPTLTFLGAELDAQSTFSEQAAALQARATARGWTVAPVTPRPYDAMSTSSLLVVPSMQPEPFGNVLLEGLVAGCRVIAFEGGGPSDLAEVFADALRVIPRSTDDLAAELRRWWATDGGGRLSAEELARTGATLRERFGRERAASEWRAVLEGLPR